MGVVTEEHQLRRLLHTGSSSSSITLKGGISDLDKKELASVNILAEAGRVNLPLQHCLAADRGGLADKRAVLLVLSGCLKIDCKVTRTAVYCALAGVVQSCEEFFEFIFYHRYSLELLTSRSVLHFVSNPLPINEDNSSCSSRATFL